MRSLAAVSPLLLSTAHAWLVPPPQDATISAAASQPETPPPCGVGAPHPCSCPDGTNYVYIQTWFSWGANAKDVYDLTGNFSDLSWVPQPIKITIGPDNTVGSYRLTTIAGDVGTFDWFEEITEYNVEDDGSFAWAFELKNVPLVFPDGSPGRFDGEWERFEARNAGEHQTDVYWTLYGCHNGGTHTFPVFQRYCHDHVHETLTQMGLLKGVTTEPFSDIVMGHKSGALYRPGDDEPAFSRENAQWILARKGVRLGEL
ncbi:hypothetical protein GGR56DRAFT_641920 [Xylariaceae sp. FL0804]|nr:hypothetical protein GGR56DRAFT_641920 [Xylariaceae sp. FL0804]